MLCSTIVLVEAEEIGGCPPEAVAEYKIPVNVKGVWRQYDLSWHWLGRNHDVDYLALVIVTEKRLTAP